MAFSVCQHQWLLEEIARYHSCIMQFFSVATSRNRQRVAKDSKSFINTLRAGGFSPPSLLCMVVFIHPPDGSINSRWGFLRNTSFALGFLEFQPHEVMRMKSSAQRESFAAWPCTLQPPNSSQTLVILTLLTLQPTTSPAQLSLIPGQGCLATAGSWWTVPPVYCIDRVDAGLSPMRDAPAAR